LPSCRPPLPQAVKNGNGQNKDVEMKSGKEINAQWKGKEEQIEKPTKKLVKMFLSSVKKSSNGTKYREVLCV